MNLLFDATVFENPHTGIAKSTLSLYRACHEINGSINFTGLFQKEICGILPAFIRLQQFKTFFKKKWRAKAFTKSALSLKPDVIHFPSNGNIPSNFENALTVMTLNDVLTLEMEGFSPEERSAYGSKVQQDIDRTDVLITISEYSKKQILKNFQCKKEPVVISCANTVMSPLEGINYKKDDYFIYVGGYAPRKGIDDIVEAFLYLHNEGRIKDKLIFVGVKQRFSTKGNKFNRLADEAADRGILEEKGYVNEKELGLLIGRAKGLIYPSRYEGFGLPVLEAMHRGCPVVTTKYTSLPEICADAAIYVEYRDMRQIADAVLKLQDEGVRRDMIKRGLARDAYYSWEKSAAAFLELLNSGLKDFRDKRPE